MFKIYYKISNFQISQFYFLTIVFFCLNFKQFSVNLFFQMKNKTENCVKILVIEFEIRLYFIFINYTYFCNTISKNIYTLLKNAL